MLSPSVDFFLNDTGDSIIKSGKVIEQLQLLETQADNGGFSGEEFTSLCHVLQHKSMPLQIFRRFICALVPSQPISGHELCDLAMFALGRNLNLNYVVKPLMQIIYSCLEYDFVTDKRPLNAIYELFLSKLSQYVLCDTISLILVKITALKDVDTRRVKVIKECYGQHGGTASLNMLRYRIRQLRPDLEPTYSTPTAGRLINNTSINRRFRKVYESGSGKQLSSGIGWAAGQLSSKIQYKDRYMQCLLPTGETINMLSGLNSQTYKRIPIHAIESVEEGLSKMDQLDLPNNILSLLSTRMGKFFLTRQDLRERFSLVLYHTLQKEFFCLPKVCNAADKVRREKRQRKFLEHVAQFQRKCFHGIPVVGRFLSEYLTEWDGEKYYYQILDLIRVVQITDFKELFDTLLDPIEEYMDNFTIMNKLLLVDAYFDLLKFWCTIEYARLTEMKGCLFPDSTQIGSDAIIPQIFALVKHICEIVELVMSSARETFSADRMWITRILVDMFISTQELFINLNLPVLIQMPESLLHNDIYSFSPLGLSKVCKYLLDQKRRVLPILKDSSRKMEIQGKSTCSSIVKAQYSTQALYCLESVTRDVLMILSPTIVFKSENSVFDRPGLDEEELLKDLFMSEHPAFLSITMQYVRNMCRQEARTTWRGLSSDRVYGTRSQETPIFSSTKVSNNLARVGSSNFYHNTLNSNTMISNPDVDAYIKFIGQELPIVKTFLHEFSSCGQSGHSVLSNTTEVTESSGIFSMQSTVPKTRKYTKNVENSVNITQRYGSKRKSEDNMHMSTRTKRKVLTEMNK